MRISSVLAFCILSLAVAWAQASPHIDHLLPAEEKPGGTVIVRGSGFTLDRKKIVVRFGGKTARVLASTESSVAVVVPDGVTSCDVTVEVEGRASNGIAFKVPGAQGEIAFVAGVRGSMGVRRAVAKEWVAAVLKMPNFLLDHVRTQADGLGAVEFLVGGRVGLDHATEIEIAGPREARDVTERGFLQQVVLKAGAVWVRLTGQQKVFRVQSGGSVIGIRGSEVVAQNVEGVDDTVWVLEGHVTYTDAAGKEVETPPGTKVHVPAGRPAEIVRSTVEKLREEVRARFPDLALLMASLEEPPRRRATLTVSDPIANVGRMIEGQFKIAGTDRPVRIHFVNASPSVIQIVGGNEQTVTTSGGASNVANFRIQAISGPSRYTIDYEILGE